MNGRNTEGFASRESASFGFGDRDGTEQERASSRSDSRAVLWPGCVSVREHERKTGLTGLSCHPGSKHADLENFVQSFKCNGIFPTVFQTF